MANFTNVPAGEVLPITASTEAPDKVL